MTLDTRIYVLDKIDYREVFIKCNQLIGADEGTRFTDTGNSLWNAPGQGLCALLDVTSGGDVPLVQAGEHSRYCDGEADECSTPCGTPCWLEVSFDTAYGYRGDNGERCGDLHARLVAELGQWLDTKGLRWRWRNEFTGQVFDRYDGLTELGRGGAEATSWYRDIAAPAIAAMIAKGQTS